jgi:hypothetical protein
MLHWWGEKTLFVKAKFLVFDTTSHNKTKKAQKRKWVLHNYSHQNDSKDSWLSSTHLFLHLELSRQHIIIQLFYFDASSTWFHESFYFCIIIQTSISNRKDLPRFPCFLFHQRLVNTKITILITTLIIIAKLHYDQTIQHSHIETIIIIFYQIAQPNQDTMPNGSQ